MLVTQFTDIVRLDFTAKQWLARSPLTQRFLLRLSQTTVMGKGDIVLTLARKDFQLYEELRKGCADAFYVFPSAN